MVESGHEYSLFGHLGGELLGKGCIVEHDGADRALCRLDVEASGHHGITEVLDVLLLAVMQLVALLQHLEHLDAGGDYHRGQGVGEEIRA